MAADLPLLPCTMDWGVYDAESEWQREGVFDNGKWRISTCNQGFQAIETYPEMIVVPIGIADEVDFDRRSRTSINADWCGCRCS